MGGTKAKRSRPRVRAVLKNIAPLWRPKADVRALVARGWALVHHKKKERQSQVGPCRSDLDELYAVIAGEYEILQGGRWHAAPPRTFAWFPRRTRYGIRQRSDWRGPVRVVSVLFRPPAGWRPGLPARPVRLTPPWWRHFLDLEARADYDEASRRVLPVADVTRFVERLALAVAPEDARARLAGSAGPRRPDTGADWLETWMRAEETIARRAAQGLSVTELAAAAGVSPTQLRRVFLAARGRPPKAVLTAWRIEEAKRLLAAGRLNVSQVARRAGFAGLPRFSAAFRKAVGCPPSAYARRGEG